MGLFDKIKTTAQSAVNSVTGNQSAPQQQPVQQVQPQQQPVQSVQPPQQSTEVVQAKQPDPCQQLAVAQEQPTVSSSEQTPQADRPLNSDPNTFFGKEFRGSGVGAGVILKSTWFFEDHLKYGDEIIPYSDLSEIVIVNSANKMTNGLAQAVIRSTNKPLTLTFNTFVLGFEKGVDYANEKISEANGSAINRKFAIRNSSSEKIEVFEDHICIHRSNGSGLVSSVNREIILISSISAINVSDGTKLVIDYKNEDNIASQKSFLFDPSEESTINEIISYVQNYTHDESDNIEEETWKLAIGEVKEFPLLGRTLKVDEKWDVFNTYRTMYMHCASLYAKRLKKKYLVQINDFDSFMKSYLPLYKEYLEKLISKTTDILVSAGVWTETNETIMQRHIENYHLAVDDYADMYQSLQLTVQNNKNKIAAVTSLVPNLVGGGFGLKGAATGIAKATAFNLVRDGAESALIDNISISASQKTELYLRIKQDVLFDRAFLDYWRVFLTLIDILNENGKSVWKPTDADSAKADNIMKNVSNPNFPQEQFPDVMVAVIGMNPYKRSIYDLLRSRGADEGEVTAISEYFGYTDKTPACVG